MAQINDKLARAIQAFNEKIRRVSIEHPELAKYQPKPIDVYEKLDQYRGRSNDRKRLISQLNKYLEPGQELPYTTKEGVNTTIWQKNVIDRNINIINKRRSEEIKKYQPSAAKGTMGTIESNNLKPRKNNIESISQKNWETYVENVESQVLKENLQNKQEQYKQNFLEVAEKYLGKNSLLYQRVLAEPAENMYRYMFTEPLLTISFFSDIRDEKDVDEIMIQQLERVSPYANLPDEAKQEMTQEARNAFEYYLDTGRYPE